MTRPPVPVVTTSAAGRQSAALRCHGRAADRDEGPGEEAWDAAAATEPCAPDAGALDVAEFELAGSAVSIVVPAPYRRARILVRLHGRPLGFLEVSPVDQMVDGNVLRRLARSRFVAAIADPLATDRRQAGSEQFRVDRPSAVAGTGKWSVVICTRNRADQLTRCLTSVAAVDHPAFEVVVVDNAPGDGATRGFVRGLAAADPRFRYVLEPRPGLSIARNAGVAAAAHDLIAFTDDDVVVDAGWLSALEEAFAASPEVTAVTGLVPAARLDTAAQRFFDGRVQWSSSCRARLFSADTDDAGALFPYTVGQIGTGANFAFRRKALLDLGSFDEALGAGSPTKGGEDLDIFLRALLGGGTIAYAPAAIVWHVHRADSCALGAQLYAYGLGLGAFAAKYLTDRTTRGELLRRLPLGLRHMATQWRRPSACGVERPPLRVCLAEAAGWFAGPGIYLRTRTRR
ncbi:MAG: glycosyltransferase [Actinobacteria bacterium]|nr:glycosyltransferase [Actinomycetota bacterium]